MPKPKDKKKEDEEIIEPIVGDEEEPKDDDEEGLVVDLDDDDDDDGEDFDDDDLSDDDDATKKSKQNKKFAQMRIENKKLKEDNERLTRTPATPSAPVPAPAAATPAKDMSNPRNWTEEQWDVYAKKDWKGAVDLRTQINAENIIEKKTTQAKDDVELTGSKKVVSEKHPELNDDTSEKTKVYLKILEENPRYLTDPKGPIHAMRDMEDRMRELGYPEEEIIAAEKRGVQKEKTRQSRVVLTSQKGRHVSDSSKQVHLSKDDLEFCKFNDIEPKEFAKNKLKMSKTKGGEVQV